MSREKSVSAISWLRERHLANVIISRSQREGGHAAGEASWRRAGARVQQQRTRGNCCAQAEKGGGSLARTDITLNTRRRACINYKSARVSHGQPDTCIAFMREPTLRARLSSGARACANIGMKRHRPLIELSSAIM